MRSHPKQSEFNFDFLFDCKYAKHLPSLIWPQLQVENCCQSWGSQQQSWNCPWIWHFRIHGEKMMQPATCPVSVGLPMIAKCVSLQHYEPKDLSWKSCYQARALEHVCKFPLVCFSIEVDLSVLKAVFIFNS